MKTLEELIGLEKCKDYVIKNSHIKDKLSLNIIISTQKLSESTVFHSVKEKLPEISKLVFCLFPPITDSFKGRFEMLDESLQSWICYPENGQGFLSDEDELVWCELNSEGGVDL